MPYKYDPPSGWPPSRTRADIEDEDTAEKSGWAYTCQADWLLYYIPGEELIYLWRPQCLRDLLPKWSREFRTGMAKNDGYATHGLLVPLEQFERYAERTISL